MTSGHTDDEWLTSFEQAENSISSTSEGYKAPGLETEDFAKSIDHTLLKLEATQSQVDALCEEARKHNFKSICVRLDWVERAIHNLHGSSIVVACVVGFHEGTQTVSEKVKEAEAAVTAGASELDMVINWPQLKEKNYEHVYNDIASVRDAAPHPIVLKVILETSQLSQFEIIAGCKISQSAGADFVKTSTGFNGPGASLHNVTLMKSLVGDSMKVKASGGVKTVHDCVAMMEAGAERIGTSNGVHIMNEVRSMTGEETQPEGGVHGIS